MRKSAAFIRGRRLIIFLLVTAAFIRGRRLIIFLLVTAAFIRGWRLIIFLLVPAAFIRGRRLIIFLLVTAAFIRGRCLFEGGVYSSKYGILTLMQTLINCIKHQDSYNDIQRFHTILIFK